MLRPLTGLAALAALATVAALPGMNAVRAQGTAPPVESEAKFLADADAALAHGQPLLPAGSCPTAAGATRLRCLLEQRYQGSARELALRLFSEHRNVAGVEQAQWMDGGFRGRIRLVPAWPTHTALRHLQAIVRAHDAIEKTLVALRARSAQAPVRYRHRNIVYRFCRSVKRTTPSAYALGWTIGYNVAGSLHKSDEAILTTIVHEIFHLNDDDEDFSTRELPGLHAAILARCGTARTCLAPYSPTATTVRGGTYYAFQPDNGDAVLEYGAELASRYLLDQRAMLEHGRVPAPAFKCATPENAQAYAKVGKAFFGGVDLAPACD